MSAANNSDILNGKEGKLLASVVFTPILFDTDSSTLMPGDPYGHRKAIEKYIDAGAVNWAVDVDFVTMLDDTRIISSYLEYLPGEVHLKLSKYPSSWYAEAGKKNPNGDYISLKDWEPWMDEYLLRDLIDIICRFEGKVVSVECGAEVSVESLWPYSAGKYYTELQPALLDACICTGVKPVLFNDTIHGDSINSKKTDAKWEQQIDEFFNYAPVNIDWDIGIHLYRHTLKNDWPEKYEYVRDYIYGKGYLETKQIHITETGYDAFGKWPLGCERDLLSEQAECWEKHLEYAYSEASIGMTWAYCYWLPDRNSSHHALLNPNGGARPAFNRLKSYW